MKNKISFILNLVLGLFLISFVSGISVGTSDSDFTEGRVVYDSPTPPTNYSLIPTVNSSDYWDDLDTPADLTTVLDGIYLTLSGTNANQDIDISPYNFLTTGTGRFDGGLLDSSGELSIGLIDRLLYAEDGTTPQIDWSTSEGMFLYGIPRVQNLANGLGDTAILLDDFTLIDSGGDNSIDWGIRQLFDETGTDMMMDWSSANVVDFDDNAITTTGNINAEKGNFTSIGINTNSPEGTMELVSLSGSSFPFWMTAYATSNPIPGFVGRSARGTIDSPTATQTGDLICATNTAKGSYMDFKVSAIGSTTQTNALRISSTANTIVRNSLMVEGGYVEPLAPIHVGTTVSNWQRAVKLGEKISVENAGSYIEFPSSSIDGYGARIGGIRTGIGTGANAIVFQTGTNAQTTKWTIDNSGSFLAGTDGTGAYDIKTAGNISAENVFLPAMIRTASNSTMAVLVGSEWVNITFDKKQTTLQKNVGHTYNDDTNTTFTIQDSGIYAISYTMLFEDSALNPDAHVGMRLVKDGVQVKGSYGEFDTSKKDEYIFKDHSFLATLTAGDEIQVQFTSDDTTVSLKPHATFEAGGGSSAQINFHKISNA